MKLYKTHSLPEILLKETDVKSRDYKIMIKSPIQDFFCCTFLSLGIKRFTNVLYHGFNIEQTKIEKTTAPIKLTKRSDMVSIKPMSI